MISLFIDARCLQDPDYTSRGVGQHVRALLYRECGYDRVAATFHLIGLTDRQLPPLSTEDRALFSAIRTTAYEPTSGPKMFLSTSPMTHSPLPMARLLGEEGVFRAAIIYDFIPYDMPERYLANASLRLAYLTCLAWLRKFDHFFPLSAFSAGRLTDLLGIAAERQTVTGVAVRESLIPAKLQDHTRPDPLVLVVGGGDRRKNPEVAVIAHARSSHLAAAGVQLVIAGDYPEFMQAEMRRLHLTAGGRPELLTFLPKVSDDELRAIYGRALCTVAPSRMEGFSIPIVEANANRCPAVASNCAAQAELLAHPEDLFAPDDAEALEAKLERIALDPSERKKVSVRQAGLWRRFTPEEVGRRFWEPLLARARTTHNKVPAVIGGNRPRIAFLSPLPPALSGVADYSFATLGPLAKRVDVEVFSDTPEPRLPSGVNLVGTISALPYLDPRFHAVVSVIGNSHLHVREFDLLLRYGAAAIAHDARMVDFYRYLLGEDRALAAASDELGRPVDREELAEWINDQGRLKALFLKEIAEAARPIIVHSSLTARYIADRYGIDSVRLPFVPYRTFDATEISAASRGAARRRLGLSANDVIVASFGIVHPVKAIEDCLWTLEMLRAWKIPARLALVGASDRKISKWLRGLAESIGVTDSLIFFDRPLREDEYRSWLIAADVAMQLRTYQLGGLSGAVLDCMAAALPTVCNAHLADAVEAPNFVRRVPDAISAVLVAEAIASIIEQGSHQRRPISERDAILETRNFDVYAERLLASIGLE